MTTGHSGLLSAPWHRSCGNPTVADACPGTIRPSRRFQENDVLRQEDLMSMSISSVGIGRILVGSILSASFLLPSIGGGNVSAQDAASATAQAAPADAVMYYELDLDLEGDQWQQADALLARVGVPNALESWKQEMLSEGDASGTFSETDMDALLGGEVAIVVRPQAVGSFVAMQQMLDQAANDAESADAVGATPVAAMGDGPVGIAVIMRPGDRNAAWDYVLRQSQSWAEKKNVELQYASGPGEDLIWSESTPAEEDEKAWEGDPFEALFPDRDKGGFAVGLSGDFIVASSNLDDVTEIFGVINGESPALVTDDQFVDLSSRVPESNVSMAYFDTSGVIDELDDETRQALERFLPEGATAESLNSASILAVSVDDNGVRMNAVSTMPEGDAVAQMVVKNNDFAVNAAELAPSGTFVFSAGEVPPTSFAGAGFVVAQAVNESMDGSVSDSGEMDAIPSADEIDAEIAKASETLGFNPASDLFDILGGEFVVFAPFPNISFDAFSWDAVAAVQTSDPVRLADTMMKIANLAKSEGDGAAVTVRTIGTDTIYKLADAENPGAPSIEFGVLGDRAVAAFGDGVSNLSASPEETLAEDAQYQEVMAYFPTEFAQVTYIDISQAAGPLMMLTGQFQTAGITDADVACLDYDSQEAAQTAYVEDPIALMDLDMDFDGTACEDAFAETGATPVAETGSLANIRAFATVTYQDGDYMASDALLYIPAPS